MNESLKKPVRVTSKTGNEKFTQNEEELPFDVLSFWQWSSSDLVNNVWRGVLAEYIVAKATGVTEELRKEWDEIDLVTPDGIKIEVKSSAYIQSWYQEDFSPIKFDIKPTKGWNAATNESSEEIKRRADVYVFCLLAHKDKETIDPLKLDQWEFYILSTKKLNRLVGDQGTITLSSLEKRSPLKCRFAEINKKIKEALTQV